MVYDKFACLGEKGWAAKMLHKVVTAHQIIAGKLPQERSLVPDAENNLFPDAEKFIGRNGFDQAH